MTLQDTTPHSSNIETAKAKSPESMIYLALALVVAAVVAAVSAWGWPALAMICLATVPVIFVVLLLLTVGK